MAGYQYQNVEHVYIFAYQYKRVENVAWRQAIEKKKKKEKYSPRRTNSPTGSTQRCPRPFVSSVQSEKQQI